MKIKYLVTVIYCVAGGKLLLAQDTVVTDKKEGAKKLHEVVISAEKDNNFGITRLKQVEGTSIYAGKKSEVIVIGDVNGNTATNNSREIYSKVSGLNIWESDGAGIQLGIGGRGLNPNRVTNFNTRQNGYDISADALGYPESYYAPPTEALERIEIVRGAASLQYGTQFGGFVNFKFKQGPENKSIEATARQTIGSFGFYNAFTSLGGTVKKLNYYTFYQYKKGDSWRPNSHFDVHTAFAGLNYQATDKLKIGLEYTFMQYLAQQAGGLTDKQFAEDPRQSNRERNWFRVNWNLAAVTVDYSFNETSRINWRTFGLYAQRDALGNLGKINRPDPPTSYRDYLQDKFRNFGSELRYLKNYSFIKNMSSFLIGGRIYRGLTLRKQGFGSAGKEPDFYYLNPDNLEHSNYQFPSKNIALFAENVFRITPKIAITPGVRWEYINTNSDGYYHVANRDLAGNIVYEAYVPDDKSSYRNFTLVGLGVSNKFTKYIELYANFSQNYRSVNFNDMRIVNQNAQVDLNLKDERGYSTDIGLRGNIKELLNFDVSLFYLRYNDRIGAIQKSDPVTYEVYRFRTNVSDSRNYGLESFAELDVFKLVAGKSSEIGISIFSNYSNIDARYIKSDEPSVKNGNRVEYAPAHILRTGITFSYKDFKLAYRHSYTSEQYTEATNTVFTTDAVDGLIPAYSIMDLSLKYAYKWFLVSAGINNLQNSMYFTRRADGYPGPGIIPSDGRSFYITLQVKI
ncbi:MAG TPA: TonB-dependent receptor [Bacteroidia bacterium]|nr:TonB-dependent receptor [Bacteroidia bacterium]HRG53601.1 TonB-dependent receptor [Bacteroidia bacterium]